MPSTTLSTIIDSSVKKAAVQYCKERGLKLCYVVEQALVELIEDEIDLEAYRLRRSKPTIPLEKLLRSAKL